MAIFVSTAVSTFIHVPEFVVTVDVEFLYKSISTLGQYMYVRPPYMFRLLKLIRA